MIKINNLSKHFGNRVLLDNVNLVIPPDEKLGIIGRNGSGKTTLMKIIYGDEHFDDGAIEIAKNYTIGYVKQNLLFNNETVIAECLHGIHNESASIDWLAEKILFGIGFEKNDLTKKPSELSGGFQVRLSLAKVLLSEPDLLLLDEPTNYLDIASIRWLKTFLKEWKKSFMLITHDRNFMDAVVTHTAIIHRAKFRKVEGNTQKLYDHIAVQEEIYEKTRINDEKKRKEVELFISRFRAKARLAGMVQSRVKQLEKSERRDKLSEIKNLEFEFTYSPFDAKSVLSVTDLKFGYTEEKILIDNLSFSVSKNDRIFIIGKNGRGKSTLLKILANMIQPLTGEVLYHPKAKIGYFAQTNISTLNNNNTVEDEIASVVNNSDKQKARNIAGSMMFEGDDALKKIAVLSGGEKARVMIGKIIMMPCNVLLLDEPTNHFDMESSDSLLEALDSFDGAVIMVSHNELFLNALANRLIIFQDNEVKLFNGTYDYFLEKEGWADEKKEGDKNESKTINKKDLRKLKSDIIVRRSKTLKPIQEILQNLKIKYIIRIKNYH